MSSVAEYVFISIIKYTTLGTCIYIFWRDLNRRAKNDNFFAKSKWERWINIFSFLTLIACIIRSIGIVCETLPIICQFVTVKNNFPHMVLNLLFTYHQITRYIHCNATPKTRKTLCCYFLLYFIGFFLLIMTLFLKIAVINVETEPAPSGSYGCIITIIGTGIFFVITLGYVFIYHLWDFLCIALYGIKLYSLTNEIENQNALQHIQNSQQDLQNQKKIMVFLNKMLIITVMYTIIGFFTNPVFLFITDALNPILPKLLVNIDILVTMMAMYLMIEGNKPYYDKIIKWILRSKCCCFLCQIGCIRRKLRASIARDLQRNNGYVQSHNNSSSRPSATTQRNINGQTIAMEPGPTERETEQETEKATTERETEKETEIETEMERNSNSANI